MFSNFTFFQHTQPDLPSDPQEAVRVLIQADSFTEEQSKFLTSPTIQRYLIARKNDAPKAFKYIKATILWREAYKSSTLYLSYKESIRHEAETGKMYVLPQPDKNGHPIIIMRPGLENSSDGPASVRYLVYTLERASRIADKGIHGKFIILVDFFTGQVSAQSCPSLSAMHETTQILQNHYPERLGGMLVFEAPSIFHNLFQMIRRFVDPVTREKLCFTKRDHTIDANFLDWSAIPKEYGGENQYEFEFNKYFESDI